MMVQARIAFLEYLRDSKDMFANYSVDYQSLCWIGCVEAWQLRMDVINIMRLCGNLARYDFKRAGARFLFYLII